MLCISKGKLENLKQNFVNIHLKLGTHLAKKDKTCRLAFNEGKVVQSVQELG